VILDPETITIFIGVVYLCVALAACVSPVVFLLTAPESVLASSGSLSFWSGQILILGPLFLIAYGWIRRRKWGRYLLIAYNALWFADMGYAFAFRMINYSESHLVFVIAVFLFVLTVLGGPIALAFQEDVKTVMSR
jgi:hypothetical protein